MPLGPSRGNAGETADGKAAIKNVDLFDEPDVQTETFEVHGKLFDGRGLGRTGYMRQEQTPVVRSDGFVA
jgi:hypothetical protein